MLIVGLLVAALIGPLYVWRNFDNPSFQRYAIGSAVAVLGAGVTPIAMGQCGFAEETSSIDHLFAWGLMAGGGWIALIIMRAILDRKDGKVAAGSSMAGEIRTRGFRLGWWVPWALLSPTLIILIVFLYAPAIATFTLSTKLARLGAPKSKEVCFGNFTELLITNPYKLVAYPLIAIALVYAAQYWKKHSDRGSLSRRGAEIASIFAALSVFVAFYGMFSPGGGGQVAYRPVYVNTVTSTRSSSPWVSSQRA